MCEAWREGAVIIMKAIEQRSEDLGSEQRCRYSPSENEDLSIYLSVYLYIYLSICIYVYNMYICIY